MTRGNAFIHVTAQDMLFRMQKKFTTEEGEVKRFNELPEGRITHSGRGT